MVMQTRGLQPSFSKGEITPLLHARVDLQSYQTGLARATNMIILPTGGACRRPGFIHEGITRNSTSKDCPVRLIPFVWNREDAQVIEFSDTWVRLRGSNGIIAEKRSPYKKEELKEINYAQSGNVVFLAHRNYPLYMFRRIPAAQSFTLEPLDYMGGPWLSDVPPEGVKISVINYYRDGEYNYSALRASSDYFTDDMTGKLIELNHAVPSKTISGTSTEGSDNQNANDYYVSDGIEVGGNWNFQTFDSWRGWVVIERSYDGGTTWGSPRYGPHKRDDPQAQGNYDISGAETEANVLYRVKIKHLQGSRPARFEFTASGYTKTNIFKIRLVESPIRAIGDWQHGPNEASGRPIQRQTADWRLGSWAGSDGFPGVVELYQGRLVLASSRGEPQTLWMSRTNDFADFSTSEEIKDDDAINITLAASDADGIQAITALDDLLVFTTSGEWRVKGAGDYGAISPTSVVAHRQPTEIGSSYIRPVIAEGGVVFVQTQRGSVHLVGYSLSSDGYQGSEISIFSGHIFRWLGSGRKITRMVFQRVPDKLIWFTLEDGQMACCTFDPGQQMNAWTRLETDGEIGDICVIPGAGFDELWAAVKRDGEWHIERMSEREPEDNFKDCGREYESCLRTLRINYGGTGTVLSNQKLDARCRFYVVRSKSAMLSPAGDRSRRKPIAFEYTSEMGEHDEQMDNGFRKDAGIEIWTDKDEPLTILGISPTITPGG